MEENSRLQLLTKATLAENSALGDTNSLLDVNEGGKAISIWLLGMFAPTNVCTLQNFEVIRAATCVQPCSTF